jgi:methylenetetrahydrofolate dehydrogenase (NAD+)
MYRQVSSTSSIIPYSYLPRETIWGEIRGS